MTGLKLAGAAREALEDRKGENICIWDVSEISGVTDFTLAVTGSSPPHLKAMANHVQQELKSKGVRAYRKSGDPDGGWLVLDYLDVIIHIFSRESREYYAIDDLWSEATQIQ